MYRRVLVGQQVHLRFDPVQEFDRYFIAQEASLEKKSG